MSVIPPEKILYQLNRARTKPLQYAELVQKQINSFVDDWKMPLLPNCYYKTNEGKKAWVQALSFLKSQKPLHQYQLNQGLTLAASDHAQDLANNNMFGHTGSQGSDMTSRIKKRCGQFYGSWGQCIGSAFKDSKDDKAVATILGLIIDDGVSSRGHRKSVFSKEYKYIGASSRLSKDGKVITVIDFHSENLNLKGGKNSYQKPPTTYNWESNLSNKEHGFGGFNQNNYDWQNNNNQYGWQNKNNQLAHQKYSGNGSTQRKVISSSTSTKTKTVNGKTTKIVTKKIKYSDGAEQQEINESTY